MRALIRPSTLPIKFFKPVTKHTLRAQFPIVAASSLFSSQAASMNTNGQAEDVERRAAARAAQVDMLFPTAASPLPQDPSGQAQTLAIPPESDDAAIRDRYRPFLLDQSVSETDWVAQLELKTVMDMVRDNHQRTGKRLRILVLYGSLRKRSYSKLLAFEAARILFRLACDVRIFDPLGLPVKNDVQYEHEKVQELRNLSLWSDGHFWVSPEQHGNLTAVFKNQIDWIPLSTGSVRPTQGRTLGIAMVSGGSQSFNTVNSLRMLGRWMRMFTIPNQSSVPKAYQHFTSDNDPCDGGSRLMPGGNRDRLVDCIEELVKYTIIIAPHCDLFADRYSERREGEEAAAEAAAAKGLINGVALMRI